MSEVHLHCMARVLTFVPLSLKTPLPPPGTFSHSLTLPTRMNVFTTHRYVTPPILPSSQHIVHHGAGPTHPSLGPPPPFSAE